MMMNAITQPHERLHDFVTLKSKYLISVHARTSLMTHLYVKYIIIINYEELIK